MKCLFKFLMKFIQVKEILKGSFRGFSKQVSLKMLKLDYKIETHRFVGHFNILNIHLPCFFKILSFLMVK